MMTKSASESTLKTSSTLNGTDNTEIREAEAAALALPWQTRVLETDSLLILDQDTNGGMVSAMLGVLQRSHNAMRFTDFMTGDLGHWALKTLCNWKEEAAMPVVNIYLKTARVDADWTIPEHIHAIDLLPQYENLVRAYIINEARGHVFDRWKAALLEEQAVAAQKEAQETFKAITGRPGMAEVAGWHAHDAVTMQKMSVPAAVQSAIKHLSMWTWATPEARARAIATRFVDGITPGMSEEARAAHVAGAVAEAIAAFPAPPPLDLKVPEFKEITDPGALTPPAGTEATMQPPLEWLAAAPAPIFFYPPLSSENHVFDPHAFIPSGNQTPMPPGSLCRG